MHDARRELLDVQALTANCRSRGGGNPLTANCRSRAGGNPLYLLDPRLRGDDVKKAGSGDDVKKAGSEDDVKSGRVSCRLLLEYRVPAYHGMQDLKISYCLWL